ncbi:MAG: NAD+ synthase [Pseudomonadota bacterium]
MAALKLALAQLNPFVGDIAGNTQQAIDACHEAQQGLGADLIVFPEMFVCGYPPEDLLFHGGFQSRIESAVVELVGAVRDITVLIGVPEYDGDKIYNAAIVFRDGEIIAKYRKWLLPNYRVFDEKRYFQQGDTAKVVDIGGINIGLTVCEDIWQPEPAAAAKAAGADLIVAINGSPYQVGAQARREDVARARVHECGLPMVYVNMVGGQDELVFDGGSFVMDATGEITFRAPAFDPQLAVVAIEHDTVTKPIRSTVEALQATEASVYDALVTGTRDYVRKHGFSGVVLGLSGGIDSGLTVAIAVDALGADRVRAVMMPYRYTSDMSKHDAAAQADLLGVRYDVISIEPIVTAALGQLADVFSGYGEDTTEENVQSRARCMLLMALSNKTGDMLLTTGNKSEMAVGYATLYGDMAGGFAPIKDCSKSLVFALARYRNTVSAAIPERVITRPPSAELRPDQKDTDSLPPYDVLDPILAAFIEEDLSVQEIVARGFDFDTVVRVLTMVRRNEYKRRQAPPGIRISERAFGRDWRYPITSGYRFPPD